MENFSQEAARIKDAYKKRETSHVKKVYSYFNPGNLYMMHRREAHIIKLFKKNGFCELGDKSILDIGCGEGGFLRSCISYGAMPERLQGVDMLPQRVEKARHLSPNIDFLCCNAARLPFKDGTFDLVVQSTVFSSILDHNMRRDIASEMMRVLKPGSFVLWYDYFYDNPFNRDVSGVRLSEIKRLFPQSSIRLERITLCPPLCRAVGRYSHLLCYVLENLKFLNTHYLGTIRKK